MTEVNDRLRGDPDPHLLLRVRGEFLEMPGLRLTCRQAQRLWGLDEGTCTLLLETLVDAGFLTRGSDGRYGLRREAFLPGKARRMAKAESRRDEEPPVIRRLRM